MLSLDKLVSLQERGVSAVENLPEGERQILQGLATLQADGICAQANRIHVPVTEAVINAWRIGLGLGLRLQISGGRVEAREQQ